MTNDERKVFEQLFAASKAEDAEIMKAKHGLAGNQPAKDANLKLNIQLKRNGELREHLAKQYSLIPAVGRMYRIVPVEPLHVTLDREYLEMNYLYCNTGGYDG